MTGRKTTFVLAFTKCVLILDLLSIPLNKRIVKLSRNFIKFKAICCYISYWQGGLIGGLVSVLFVGWISFGKLISSGVRVSPKLEPASTWNCPSLNVSQLTNTTMNYTNPLVVINGTEMTTDAYPTHSPHEP